MTELEQQTIRRALVILLHAEAINWDVLRGIAYSFSYGGWTRREIVEFFWKLMKEHDQEISAQNMDMLGDFNCHLVGQCNTADVIRLAGDPADLDGLARKVAADMRGWTPPV